MSIQSSFCDIIIYNIFLGKLCLLERTLSILTVPLGLLIGCYRDYCHRTGLSSLSVTLISHRTIAWCLSSREGAALIRETNDFPLSLVVCLYYYININKMTPLLNQL